MKLNVATEEEARAQANVIRKNSLDFQMATMMGDEDHPPMPMIIIDKMHRDRAFVKRTPWLAPGNYGTRYMVQWNMGIPFGHVSLHVIFSNDETKERNEFWLMMCPLQMYVLKGQPKAFTNIAKMIRQTYGRAIKDTPIAIMSEQAWLKLEGHKAIEVMHTPENQAFFENNMVMVIACDFTIFCQYFEDLWHFWGRLPPTQPLVDQVSHFPCRYCEISKQVLRKQGRIMPREAVKAFIEDNPELARLLEKIGDEAYEELEDKVIERSKEMESGEYGNKF